MKLLTNEYKELLVKKHTTRPWGGAGASWVPYLMEWLKFDDVKTVLDYGSGRRTFKPAMLRCIPELDIREYDPGTPGYDMPPDPADLVVCTDVLEHFEPELVDNGLEHLRNLTIKHLFLVIACQLSGSSLPDGRNTHLTVKPCEWWLQQLRIYYGQQFNFKTHEKTKGRLVIMLTRVR